MNDPIQFIKAIKNPQEFVLNTLGTNTNPIMKKLLEMAKNGDREGMETFARNFFASQGKSFDEIMEMFKK